MPSISVIVPVYQAEEFVERCVQSIVDQTFQDWELLLIDDGSRDKSGAICKALAEKESRIRYFHKKNGGVSTARNYGLREATGTYITFVDSDDWIDKAMFADLYDAVEQAGGDSAGCGLTYITTQGDTATEAGVLPAGVYNATQIRKQLVEPLVSHRIGAGVINGYSVRFLFSKEVIDSQKITFEGAYLEDELFLLDYFVHAQGLAMVDKPYYYYLQNPASVTRRYLPTFLKVFARFLQRKEAFVHKHGLEESCPQWQESTNWAGLLIAVANEYAAGNPAAIKERQRAVKTLCQREDMARAIATLRPTGLSRNKEIVVRLIQGKHYFMLSLLYRLKNRI